MTLSHRAKLLAANPGLPPEYLLDPRSDPNKLSDQLKELTMNNHRTQIVLDQMMPIVGYFEHGRFVAVAKCDEPNCQRETRWSAEKMPKATFVRTKIRNRGWLVDKKRCVCDHCTKRKRSSKGAVTFTKAATDPEPKTAIGQALARAITPTSIETSGQVQHGPTGRLHPPLPPVEIVPPIAEGEESMPTETIAPTDNARAAKREAYALLLDNYDDQNKRYKGDCSDEVIAKKTGLAVSKVAAIRDEDFGPAGPPPQLINLKETLGRLEARVKGEETKILQSIDTLEDLKKQIERAQSDVDQLVQIHGWEVR